MDISNASPTNVNMPKSVQARCDECGSSYRYERGDAFVCPYCSCDFTEMKIVPGGGWVEFFGKKRYA